jgi:O-antigen/teichoic acid export membrane protein
MLFGLKIILQKTFLIKLDFDYSYTFFFLVISYAWYDLSLRFANVNQLTSTYSKIIKSRAIVSLIFGLILYYSYGIHGIFVALIASSFIFPVLFIKSNYVPFRLDGLDKKLLKSLLVYGLPLAITSGLTMIVDFSDRFLISTIVGKEQSGIYSANYDFVLQTLGFLIGVFYLSFFPIINKIYRKKDAINFEQQFAYYFNILLLVSLPVSVSYILLAEGFSNLFLGASFRSFSGNLLPVITLGVLIGNLKAYAIDLVFYLRKKTLLQVMPSAFVALINVALNLLWIPQFGSIGAAYATLISFILGMFLSILVAMHCKMMPRLNMDTIKVLLATLTMLLCLIILKPSKPYDLFAFLFILTSSFFIYLGALWYLDTLMLKQLVANLLKKLYRKYDGH